MIAYATSSAEDAEMKLSTLSAPKSRSSFVPLLVSANQHVNSLNNNHTIIAANADSKMYW